MERPLARMLGALRFPERTLAVQGTSPLCKLESLLKGFLDRLGIGVRSLGNHDVAVSVHYVGH